MNARSQGRRERLVMLEVPGINRLGFGFGRAGEKKGVIDAAPGETTRGDVLNGGEVFLR